MTKVGLKEASELAGVAASTIVRARKKGQLSADKDANGRDQYEVSELERVYGRLKSPAIASDEANSLQSHGMQSATQRLLEQEIEALKREAAQLSETLADARQERDRWRDEASDWKRQAQALLTDQTGQGVQKAGFWKRLFGTG